MSVVITLFTLKFQRCLFDVFWQLQKLGKLHEIQIIHSSHNQLMIKYIFYSSQNWQDVSLLTRLFPPKRNRQSIDDISVEM